MFALKLKSLGKDGSTQGKAPNFRLLGKPPEGRLPDGDIFHD
jgi:hypothetical protein